MTGPYSQLIGLREKNTGKSHISWENLWFPVEFPLSQLIETWDDCDEITV